MLKKPWYDIGFQIDRLLIRSFIPPFLMSFFIAVVVLIMQFLWRFIEDIIGKGVGALVVAEMFFYKSVSLFPLAFPIAVLLASVMVMGNLAERYELTSLKSAGVPLTRILAPLVAVSFVIAAFSFYCSNTIIPIANLKYGSRLYDIRNQKPTLSIEPGVFNEDFKGYAIRVGKKHNDKQTIEDIMVYDDSQRNRGKLNVVTAQTGKMYVDPVDGAFVMTLYDGHQYSETEASADPGDLPFVVSDFKEWTRRFDLSEFDLDRTEEEQFKSHHTMKSARQIAIEIDTIDLQIQQARVSNPQPFSLLNDVALSPESQESRTIDTARSKTPAQNVYRQSSVQPSLSPRHANRLHQYIHIMDSIDVRGAVNVASRIPTQTLRELKSHLVSRTSISLSTADRNARSIERLDINRRKHVYELHWKFSLAAACVVMLLIGGPMGTIVRKGGFGYPLLVAIFFFTFFIMANISCKKLNDSQNLPPVLAAWMPVILLGVISLFLTYKALQDARMFNVERLRIWISKVLPKRKAELA